MKKLLAIALAVVMVFALTVSVFAEEVVYSMTETGGQYMESISLADGAVLDGGSDGIGARIATNWVGGGTVYSAIVEALQTADAVVRITYTGEITQIGFQTENGEMEFADVTDVTEVDGKNVAIVPCADIVAAAPVAIANDNVGWGNFMLVYADGTVLYGFEVVTGYEAAAEPEATEDEPEATEDEPEVTEPEATEPEAAPEAAPAPAPSAPATGLALAVIPAVMALAAVAVSKKH